MKTKKSFKKLTLNKATVSNLEKLQMSDIRGKGTFGSCAYTCPECDTDQTCNYCPDVDTEYPTCYPGWC
jgi:natural product precursor